MLQLLGRLTTPPSGHGITLAEHWAYVRYFAAMSNHPDLRLTNDFADLDAHQKTILSDDFGVGIPIYWLKNALNFQQECAGNYFLETLAATVGAYQIRTAKRGPNKSPDFVAQDNNGIWHVVECKGTQSGVSYRETQLGNADAQKRSILFPPGHSGQKLACGLFIRSEGGTAATNLKIIDPPDDENAFEVREQDLPIAKDILMRSSLAISLRLAGFQTAADAVASPAGPTPSSHPTAGLREESRTDFIADRRNRALEELSRRGAHSVFYHDRKRFYGRELLLDFARPIFLNNRETNAVRIRQGVSADALNRIVEDQFPDKIEPGRDTPSKIGPMLYRLDRGEEITELSLGTTFFSQVDLSPKRRRKRPSRSK